MKKILMFILILFLIASCSTTKIVQPDHEKIVYYRGWELINKEAIGISVIILLEDIDNVYILVSINGSEQVMVEVDFKYNLPEDEWMYPEDPYTTWCFTIGPFIESDIISVSFVFDQGNAKYIIKDEPLIIIFNNSILNEV